VSLPGSSLDPYHRVPVAMKSIKQWRINTTPGGGFVDWRSGHALPGRWKTVLDGEDLPYLVELEFAAGDAGADCRAIRFVTRDVAAPISARLLRSIPIAECIQAAIASAAVREERRSNEIAYTFGGRDITEQMEHARAAPRNSDEHLRAVAEVYSRADEKPTQAVQDAWPFNSYSTASRWVMQARRRGFLPPTTRGRGGTSTIEPPKA
jgi:hypothetical protein